MPPVISEAYTGAGLTYTLDNQSWKATRIFEVSGASTKTQAINSLSAVGVVRGSTHPESTRLICTSIDSDDNPYVYKITVQYTIPTLAQFDPDPLKAKTRWRWQPASETIHIDRDLYNNPIVNSAGVPFRQPSQSFEGCLGLVAIKNEPYYDVQKAIQCMNRTNLLAFNVSNGKGPTGAGGGVAGTVEAGQVFCVLVDSQTDIYQGVPYATVSYHFRFKEGRPIDGMNPPEYDAFWDVRRDESGSGWYTRTGGSKMRGRIVAVGTDGYALDLDHDVLLDGKGKPLDTSLRILSSEDGTVSVPIDGPPLPTNVRRVTTANAVYIARRKFRQINLPLLGL